MPGAGADEKIYSVVKIARIVGALAAEGVSGADALKGLDLSTSAVSSGATRCSLNQILTYFGNAARLGARRWQSARINVATANSSLISQGSAPSAMPSGICAAASTSDVGSSGSSEISSPRVTRCSKSGSSALQNGRSAARPTAQAHRNQLSRHNDSAGTVAHTIGDHRQTCSVSALGERWHTSQISSFIDHLRVEASRESLTT
jgi:hypothetical protein